MTKLLLKLTEGTPELRAAWSAKYGTEVLHASFAQARACLAFVKGALPVKVERRKVCRHGTRTTYETHRICQARAVVQLENTNGVSVGCYTFCLRDYSVRS